MSGAQHPEEVRPTSQYLRSLTKHDEIIVIVGFFDLQGYAKWSEGRSPRELLDLATELFNRTGRAVEDAGGHLIKAIGDAGLFVFPAGKPDRAVLALMKTKRGCDVWLAELGYPNAMSVRVQVGPIACGRVTGCVCTMSCQTSGSAARSSGVNASCDAGSRAMMRSLCA